MEHDLPVFANAPPDGAALRKPRALAQGVGEQVYVGRQFADVGVAGLSIRFVNRIAAPGIQHIEDVVTRVALTGRADFPEILHGHACVIGARSTEPRMVENRLASTQFVQHGREMRWRREIRFLAHALPAFSV